MLESAFGVTAVGVTAVGVTTVVVTAVGGGWTDVDCLLRRPAAIGAFCGRMTPYESVGVDIWSYGGWSDGDWSDGRWSDGLWRRLD